MAAAIAPEDTPETMFMYSVSPSNENIDFRHQKSYLTLHVICQFSFEKMIQSNFNSSI